MYGNDVTAVADLGLAKGGFYSRAKISEPRPFAR